MIILGILKGMDWGYAMQDFYSKYTCQPLTQKCLIQSNKKGVKLP